MAKLNQLGRHLQASLIEVSRAQAVLEASRRGETLNVVGAGGVLSTAYEQLRNATENAEEHLLFQNAIRRFLKRLEISQDGQLLATSGEELVVELTLAGYIANDTVHKSTASAITQRIQAYYAQLDTLLSRDSSAVADKLTAWVFDDLSHRTSLELEPRFATRAYVNLAREYFNNMFLSTPEAAEESYRDTLLISIHRKLLKSDTATIRSELLLDWQVDISDGEQFIESNLRIDQLISDAKTSNIMHAVDRQGVVLRVLRHMIDSRSPGLMELDRRETFLELFEQQVAREYANVVERVNRAVVRSVVFLIFTKLLVGIAIEIPYDIWAFSRIEWSPLLINLVFPPLYMIALRFTLNTPGYANTKALVDQVDTMLYGESHVVGVRSLETKHFGPIFTGIYAVFGLVVFGAVTWLLLNLKFSIVHIVIFFVFISAASFLGFRISRTVRDIETVRSSSNSLTFIRDMIYLPFVAVGRWMSEQYAQINLVSMTLDLLIELPLKTVLRLVRQWGAFIDDRKDRI